MNNMMRILLKRGFRWLGKNYIEMMREAGKLQGWGIVALTFEMDQNWN